jgi:hypothetical protein
MRPLKGSAVRLNEFGRNKLSHMVAAYYETDWEHGQVLEVDPDGIANVVQFKGDRGIRCLRNSYLSEAKVV